MLLQETPTNPHTSTDIIQIEIYTHPCCQFSSQPCKIILLPYHIYLTPRNFMSFCPDSEHTLSLSARDFLRHTPRRNPVPHQRPDNNAQLVETFSYCYGKYLPVLGTPLGPKHWPFCSQKEFREPNCQNREFIDSGGGGHPYYGTQNCHFPIARPSALRTTTTKFVHQTQQ